MQFVRNGPPVPGEEKVWLRDKSYRANRERDVDVDDQIKQPIHTSSGHNYESQLNNLTNDKETYSNWTNDAGETHEMLEITTQTKINCSNGRDTNGHHVNNNSGPIKTTTSTDSNDAYNKI